MYTALCAYIPNYFGLVLDTYGIYRIVMDALPLETGCCACVIACGRGHTVSAKPGGHTACFGYTDKICYRSQKLDHTQSKTMT